MCIHSHVNKYIKLNTYIWIFMYMLSARPRQPSTREYQGITTCNKVPTVKLATRLHLFLGYERAGLRYVPYLFLKPSFLPPMLPYCVVLSQLFYLTPPPSDRVKNFHSSISSWPAMGSAQPPLKWIPEGSSPGGKAAGTWGSTHLHLVPRSTNVGLYIHSTIRLHGVVLNYHPGSNDLYRKLTTLSRIWQIMTKIREQLLPALRVIVPIQILTAHFHVRKHKPHS
jgi:hypothetical protein